MGLLEKGTAKVAEAYGNFSDSIGDLVSSKKQFVTKQVLNVVLLLVILLVFGCFDFLNLVFHYEYLFNANYWINVGTKAVADICSYNIGVNFIIDDIIKRDLTLQNLKKVYEDLNEVKQSDFDEFLIVYNREEKKTAYKNDITHRLYLLNKYARRADKVLYSKIKDTITIDDISNPNAKINRYCLKRKQLEYLRSEEYINQNIETIDVNYKDVDSAVFEIEINGAQKVVKNQTTGSVSKGRIIASSTTLLGVVAGSMVIQSISLAPSQEQFENQMVAAAHYAAKISSDIAIIVWQFLRGILGTHNIVSRQITVPLAERVKILKKYYAWRKDKGEFVPNCYLNLLKEKEKKEPEQKEEKEEKVIEMTREEFEKLTHKE